MKFIKHPYLGESARESYRKLRWKISHGAGTIDTYVVCMPEYSSDPLEYFNAALLRQHFYRKNPPVVIGIAVGEDEAVSVVEDIINDCMEKTGSLDVRSFVMSLVSDGGKKK